MISKKIEKRTKVEAQSVLEYVMILLILLVAFLSVSNYYKRSLQGRYRQAADVLSAQTQFTPP